MVNLTILIDLHVIQKKMKQHKQSWEYVCNQINELKAVDTFKRVVCPSNKIGRKSFYQNMCSKFRMVGIFKEMSSFCNFVPRNL